MAQPIGKSNWLRGSCARIGCLAFALLGAAGCSPRDAPTYTPVYHQGTPTNRSSVNSWELNTDPMHTQPGLYGGKPVVIKPVPSRRGYEPNDPLAERVYGAIAADAAVHPKYLSAEAKNGVVILLGTVPNAQEKARAIADARKVPGVTQVRDQVEIVAIGTQ